MVAQRGCVTEENAFRRTEVDDEETRVENKRVMRAASKDKSCWQHGPVIVVGRPRGAGA